jgi:hypothetical protein
MLVAGGAAVAQNTVPDAQVESNVLKALASAPELATESITTNTMYGTVTLSGTVRDENTRRRAENLAANSNGVKKVVDELRLADGSGAAPALEAQNQQAAPQQQPGPQPGMVLQSDGTYAPAPAGTSADPAPGTAPAETAQRNNPDADYQLDQQRDNQNPNAQQQQPMPNGPMPNQQANNQPPVNPYPGAYPADNSGRRPLNPQGYPYPQQQQGYPQQQRYSNSGQPVYGNDGQTAGIPVTVPSGALLRVRVNRTLSSNRTPAGTVFDGIVTNDVVANGFVAIPRGAAVQGTVIEAKASGVLKGRGELSIQLTQITLAGKTYPLVSDVWAHNGGDKTIETVNKTAGFGAGGALLGALAGGGEGAAIGAGVGAALGLGSSAASGKGQVFVPAEALVTFHTAQPVAVQTVSEQEMQRLAYGVPPGADGPRYRRRVVVGPVYYPQCGPYPCQAQYGVTPY